MPETLDFTEDEIQNAILNKLEDIAKNDPTKWEIVARARERAGVAKPVPTASEIAPQARASEDALLQQLSETEPQRRSNAARDYLRLRGQILDAGIDPETGRSPGSGLNIAEETLKGPGKEMAQAGRFAVGALADIGARAEAGIAGDKIPGFENVAQVANEGMLPERIEPLPTEKERRFLPAPLRATEAAAQGLIQTAPQMALTAVTPQAAPLWFGLTPEGFDPKSAAMAVALPVIGKYSGEIAGSIAQKLGISTPEALNIIKATTAAGAGGATVYGDSELQIRELESRGEITPQQAQDMRIDAFGNAAIMATLSATGTKFEPGIRDAAKKFLAQVKNEPLPSVEPAAQRPGEAPIRKLGVRLSGFPDIAPLHEQVLAEQRPGHIFAPGEVPAVEQLKRSGEVIPGGEPTRRVERPGGGEAQGGKVSFSAPAEAEAIPSARQAAIKQAFGGAEQPPDIINQVRDLVGNKDRLSLEELEKSLSGASPKIIRRPYFDEQGNLIRPMPIEEGQQAPSIGVSRSTAGDMLRLIRARLQELKTGKYDPELSALRKTLYGEEVPPMLKEPPIQAEVTSEIVKPKALLPEKGVTNASENPEATKVYGDVQPQPEQGAREMPAEERSGRVQPQAERGIPGGGNAEGAKGEVPLEKPKNNRQKSMEFDRLVIEHAAQADWAKDIQLLTDVGVRMKQQQPGGIGIKARIAHGKELKIARRNAARDLGIDPTEIETVEGRAKALEKLQQHVAEKYPGTEQQKANFDKATESGKRQVEANDLSVGDVLNVKGEDVKVTDVNPDNGDVTLEDGTKFGTQVLKDGERIYAEEWHTVPKEDFLPAEENPFSLEEPETVEQQKARLAKEEEARAAKSQEEAEATKKREMLERANQRTGGDLGSAGQGGLFEEPGQQEIFQSKPKLEKAEDAINKRIDEIRKEGRMRLIGDPELGLLQLGKGAIKIAKGVRNFNRWSIEMVNEFGERIRPKLQTLWNEATQIFKGNHPSLEMSENGVIQRKPTGSTKTFDLGGSPESIAKEVGNVKFDGTIDFKLPGQKPRWQWTLTEPGRQTTFYTEEGATPEQVQRKTEIKRLQFDKQIEDVKEAESRYDKGERATAVEQPEKGMGARLREARKQNNLGDNGGFITLPTRADLDRIVEWVYKKSPEAILQAARHLDQTRRGIAWRFANGKLVDAIAYTKDAANNAAAIFANRHGNEIEAALRRATGDKALIKRFGAEWFKNILAPWHDPKELAKSALTFMVESGQDRSRLEEFRLQLENATAPTGRSTAERILWEKWREKALSAIDYADANFDNLAPIAEKYQIKTGLQLSMEGLSGIETRHRDNYVMHAQDVEGRFDFEPSASTGRGDSVRFKKLRSHDTYADSIAAGVIPQSLDAVKLLKARLNLGQRAMNNRAWMENLGNMTDAKTGQPLSAPFTMKVVTKPVTQFRQVGNRNIPVADQGWSVQYRDVNGVRTPVQVAREMQTPDGYERVNFAGQDVAIHKGFAPLFHALTDPSALAVNPAARKVLQGLAAGKHVLLAFDSFHMMRLGFWASIVQQKPSGYKRGLTLLDQTLPEIMKLAQDGEIPRSYVKNIVADKALVDNVMMKTGYNVGSVTDNLYSHLVQKIPLTGAFNKWLFGQFQRGAMTSAWLYEFKRVKEANPHLSDMEAGRQVSKDLNTRFGSLGSQGWFKSKTFQDLARATFLAPQWNEGLIKSELGGIKGLAKGLVTGDPAQVGTLGKAIGTALLFNIVANQIINLATRGHPTTENKEEGMDAKVSAWVPDVTGSGSGMMISPYSLPLETLHLVAKKAEKTGSAQDAMRQYLQGRLGVGARPLWVFLTKRDWADRPIKNEDMLKELGKAALPVPISAGAVTRLSAEMAERGMAKLQGKPYEGGTSQRFPGEFQRQAMSSFGIRNESAPSPEQRIGALAKDFRESKGIKENAEFYSSDYAPLAMALRIGNKDEALKQAEEILQKKTLKDIGKHFKNWPTFPFTGSKKNEIEFFNKLTDEQKQTYLESRKERRNVAAKAFELFSTIAKEKAAAK